LKTARSCAANGERRAPLDKTGDRFLKARVFAMSMVKKPARSARQGINPFTKEPTVFAAKPAGKAVKARPVKAIKDTAI
jgi:DNA-binding protein HU-beta